MITIISLKVHSSCDLLPNFKPMSVESVERHCHCKIASQLHVQYSTRVRPYIQMAVKPPKLIGPYYLHHVRV